jgi:hypothetical protein
LARAAANIIRLGGIARVPSSSPAARPKRCYFAASLLRAACSAEVLAGAAGETRVFVEFNELVPTAGELLDDPAAPELRVACSALLVAGAAPLVVCELLVPVVADVPAVPAPDVVPEDGLPPLASPPLPPDPPPPPPCAKDGLAPARSAAMIIAYVEVITVLPSE